MSKITLTELPGLAEQLGMSSRSVEAIESFLFHCRIRNLTPKTLHCYAERLETLLRWAKQIGKDVLELGKHDLQKYISSLVDRVSPATTNGRIIVFKVFFKFLKNEGYLESDPTTEIKKLKQPRLIKPVLTCEDIERILGQFNKKTFYGIRDYCMIRLTYDSMIRLNELLTIRTEQLDVKANQLKVFGKGRKERNIFFNPTTAHNLRTYLIKYRKNIPGELLFCQKSGKPIDFRRAHRIFSNPGKKIGIKFYPHLARHSGATVFVRQGGSLAFLQRILGHSTLAVTEKYIHIGDSDILTAYEKFSPASRIRV